MNGGPEDHRTERARDRLAALRDQALDAFRAGIHAANPARVVATSLRKRPPERPFEAVLAIGKASLGMLEGAAPWLPDEMDGVVVTTSAQASGRAAVFGVEVFGASHPVPDTVGELAASAALELASLGPRHVLVLLSGGASALLPAPVEGVSLSDKVAATEALLACGATIHEINAVRKHLSRIKGGGLARALADSGSEATVLVLSDVPGDDLSVVGSGPTVGDPSTFQDCWDVLVAHGLDGAGGRRPSLPAAVLEHLRRGVAGEVPETLSPSSPALRRVRNRLVGSNRASVLAAAESLRWSLSADSAAIDVHEEPVVGEAREVGAALVSRLGVRSTAMVSGGETTVTLRGDGRGGRSQELALACAIAASERGVTSPWCLLSAGTDGRDGPTDAAGALVDAGTVARGGGLEEARAALERNDSYRFLSAAGDLVRTGETGTNVADLQILLVP